MKLFRRDSLIKFEDGNLKFYVSQNDIDISESPTGSNIADITLRRINGIEKRTKAVSEILDFTGNTYGTTVDDLVFAIYDGQDAKLRDRTTRPIIAKFNRVTNSTTLASNASLEDTTITVTSATGIVVGSYIILFNPTEIKFGFATVTSIAGSPVITLDTRLDFAFPAGTFVDIGITNLATAIGTLADPIIFGLRGTGAPPGVDLDVNLTRIFFTLVANSPVDLTTFGNLARLINGLALRRRNDVYENIFNVKDNGELAGLLYDMDVSTATNPAQGQDGYISRLTFTRIGVAVQLPVGDDLELLVQDDLNTAQTGDSITLFEAVAEGYITEEP